VIIVIETHPTIWPCVLEGRCDGSARIGESPEGSEGSLKLVVRRSDLGTRGDVLVKVGVVIGSLHHRNRYNIKTLDK
jgi:hypothetical protein